MSEIEKPIRLSLTQPFVWVKAGDVLKFSGQFLHEGTWTGIDGTTIFYPRQVIYDGMESVLRKNVKYGHAPTDTSVVGVFTGVRRNNGGMDVEGNTWNSEAITSVQSGGVTGLSPEMLVRYHKDENDKNIADKISILAGAFVENPACIVCRIDQTESVRLRMKLTSEKVNEPTGNGVKIMVNDKSGEATKGFFDWVSTQLADAKVEASKSEQIMNTLREAIKIPTTVNVTSPDKMTIEVLEASNVKLAEKDATIVDLTTQVESKDTELSSKATEITSRDEKITTLDAQVVDLTAKLGTANDSLNAIVQAEVDAVIEEIKVVDKEFDSKSILEGIDCLTKQKTLLGAYLGTIKRISKPQNTDVDLHVGDPDDKQGKIKKVMNSMFGEGYDIATLLGK